MLDGDAIEGGLDRGVEQLDDQHEQQAADQRRALEAGAAEPECERSEDRDQDEFLAEGILVAGGRSEAGQRIAGGVQDPLKPGFPLVGTFVYVGIPSVNSNSSWAERLRPRRGLSLS